MQNWTPVFHIPGECGLSHYLQVNLFFTSISLHQCCLTYRISCNIEITWIGRKKLQFKWLHCCSQPSIPSSQIHSNDDKNDKINLLNMNHYKQWRVQDFHEQGGAHPTGRGGGGGNRTILWQNVYLKLYKNKINWTQSPLDPSMTRLLYFLKQQYLKGFSSCMVELLISFILPPGERPRSDSDPAKSGWLISATTWKIKRT